MDPGPVIFIVDDDAEVRRALRRLVSSAGYRTEEFDCATAFLNDADLSSYPACLLLDVDLPDMNGLELQRRLDAALPIVFICREKRPTWGSCRGNQEGRLRRHRREPRDGSTLRGEIRRGRKHVGPSALVRP
ncbi:response regulator transcription factor [Paraburkholderia sp. Cpub6]|uniref:response regulator transcription factor n=1 Tax=Paraburkholderia sp. Cpub6 TaxID=2723094 RepID=UPI00161C8079|nr:response regulator [Paraburkholderia sp. Cpub6]